MSGDNSSERAVSDLAIAIGAPYATAYRMVLTGRVRSRRLPSGRFLIPAEEIDRVARERSAVGTAA